jgi:hypothetical protein
MPPSGLRQVWFLRRSREPHINPSAVHAPVVSEESSWQLSESKIAFKRHALALRAADEHQPSRHLWH